MQPGFVFLSFLLLPFVRVRRVRRGGVRGRLLSP